MKKNIEADDEKSIIKDDDLSIEDHLNDIIPETIDKEDKDKSLKDKLKSDVSTTIVIKINRSGVKF